MWCCGERNQPKNAVDILKSKPDKCSKHSRDIRFVCRTCPYQSLVCEECIIEHQAHDWTTLETFLTDDVIKLFQSGHSKSGKAVEQFVDRVAMNLIDYQERIQRKLKQVIAAILLSLERLKSKFPVHGGYHISGTTLNQKNIREIDRILSYQKQIFDTNRLENTFNEIIQASESNITENLEKMQETLSDRDWQLLEAKQISKIQNNYMSVYRKIPPNRKFTFSMVEKNSGIKLSNGKLTAIYSREIPLLPVVLLDKPFREGLCSVGFKITKMQTHAHFFDMTRIYIGLCNPELAESFAYLNLAKPSKGAYMISSEGKCYHSKLPEYNDTSLAFSFRGGDIVTISLNIDNGEVTFQKKTGKLPFWKKQTMPLGLQMSFVLKLKPFVMFAELEGAEITILNQTQLRLELDGKEVYPVVDV